MISVQIGLGVFLDIQFSVLNNTKVKNQAQKSSYQVQQVARLGRLGQAREAWLGRVLPGTTIFTGKVGIYRGPIYSGDLQCTVERSKI